MPDIGTMHQLNPEPPHIGTMHQLGPEPLHTGEIITPQAQAEEYAREAQESADNAALSAAAAQSAAETAQQAAESIAPALDEKADAIHTAAVPAPIVSIPDAAAAPVDALTVGIEPVQDLHGYDNPWPAGGGVNKIDVNQLVSYGTTYGLTVSFDGDWIVLSGEYTHTNQAANFRIATLRDTSVFPVTKFKAFPDSNTSSHMTSTPFGLADGNKTLTIYISGMVQGETYNLRCKIVGYEGDTAPTEWTPYSNICPISGFDSVKVSRTGKNLAAVNMFSTSHDTVMTFSPSIPAGTYSYSYIATRTGSSTDNGAIRFVYDDGTYTQEYLFISTERKTKAITFQKSVASIYVYSISGSYAESGNYTLTCTDFQLELGSTASSYEPYQGETYPITFPSEAGTVYGGTLDVTNGVLTVDRAMVEYDGSSDETWGEYAMGSENYCCVAYPSGKVIGYQKSICNEFKNQNRAFGASSYGIYSDHPSLVNTYFRMPNAEVTTRAEFLTWIAEHPIQLCYELANPITYTLTPQEIRTFLGANNIWADTGDVTVGYKADTKLYIDKKFAELQALILEH